MSSERDLLEAMVQERDYELKSLKEVTTKQEIELSTLSEELNKIKVKQKKIQSMSKVDIKELTLSKTLLQKRFDAAMDKQLLSNAEKVAILKHNLQLNNGKNNNISKQQNMDIIVKTLQSNLTKSIRHLCTLEQQIDVLKSQSEVSLRSLKYEMNDAREERSREELELLNQLATLDREKGMVEDELRRKILSQSDVIKKLREEMDVLKEDCKTRNSFHMVSPTSVMGHGSHFANNDDDDMSPSSSPRSTNKRGTRTTISEISEYSDEEQGDDSDDDEILVISGPPMEAFQDSNSVILEQLTSVAREKDCMEQDLRHELRLQRETITQLEHRQTKHQTSIQQLHQTISDKDVQLQQIRHNIEEELKQSIQFIMEGQQEALLNLARMAALREKADESIGVIQDLIAPFQEALLTNITQNGDENENTRNMITYYTTALLKSKLLYEEMKASLSYIEIQLKFQQSSLQAISNNDSAQNKNHPQQDNNNTNVLFLQTKVKNMQENILNSLRTLERKYKQKFTVLQEDFQRQHQSSLHEVHTKQITIQTLEQTISELEQNTSFLKQEAASSNNQETLAENLEKENKSLVQSLQEKENVILSLSSRMEESEIRQEMLKMELKKMKQKVKLMEADDMLSSLERDSGFAFSSSGSMPEE